MVINACKIVPFCKISRTCTCQMTPFYWFREIAPPIEKIPPFSRKWVRARCTFWSGVGGPGHDHAIVYRSCATLVTKLCCVVNPKIIPQLKHKLQNDGCYEIGVKRIFGGLFKLQCTPGVVNGQQQIWNVLNDIKWNVASQKSPTHIHHDPL